MEKIIFILGLACLMANISIAQVRLNGHSLPELRQSSPLSIPHTSLGYGLKQLTLFLPFVSQPQLPPLTEMVPNKLPQAWSYTDLAFFCRLEVKLEKAAKLPIKFRLGEVQYVENMEGKYGNLQQQIRH